MDLKFELFYLRFCGCFQKNSLDFERFTCDRNPNGVISYLKCDVRHIGRRRLRFDLAANITKPMTGAYMHLVAYYKYNTYRRIAVNHWEDGCGWLNGTAKSFFLDWTLKRVQNYIGADTNINHPCPYEGYTYLKINNISVDHFPLEPLMPSGRYRLDINITESDKKTSIFSAKLYMSVSDHRIEQY